MTGAHTTDAGGKRGDHAALRCGRALLIGLLAALLSGCSSKRTAVTYTATPGADQGRAQTNAASGERQASAAPQPGQRVGQAVDTVGQPGARAGAAEAAAKSAADIEIHALRYPERRFREIGRLVARPNKNDLAAPELLVAALRERAHEAGCDALVLVPPYDEDVRVRATQFEHIVLTRPVYHCVCIVHDEDDGAGAAPTAAPDPTAVPDSAVPTPAAAPDSAAPEPAPAAEPGPTTDPGASHQR